MAAETSGDAKVPVALALAKLAVVFAWKNAEELKLIIGKLTVLSKSEIYLSNCISSRKEINVQLQE
jgi:hypothetical protein